MDSREKDSLLRKARSMSGKKKDDEEKAILFLLWGRKGWEGYKDPTQCGFSIEKLFEFLKAQKKADSRS